MPEILSRHATCRYSWISPPSRSRRTLSVALGVVGEWPQGSGLAERSVWPMGVVAAPRGAALYRSRSGQGREEMSRDLMADP